MQTAIISHLVGSAQHRAIADDSLKDEDNAAWVITLDQEIRQQWLDRIEWIRLADRLAEGDLITVGQSDFSQFYQAWQTLQTTGQVNPDSAHANVLHRMQAQWLGAEAEARAPLNVQAWNRYLTALKRYHAPDLVIDRLSDSTQMLETLAGSFFQVLPNLSEAHWQAVYAFGAVDQFYNNLRDMCEDAEQGICYMPREVLERFGLTRSAILDLSACSHPGYRPMMQFWVGDYRSRLYQKAWRFIMMPDLHPAWKILRTWSLYRYRRIERVLRQCNYDYVQFPEVYWPAVQQDLFPPGSGCSLPPLTSVLKMIAQSQSGTWDDNLADRWAQLPANLLWEPLIELEEASHVFASDSFGSAGHGDRGHRTPVAAR